MHIFDNVISKPACDEYMYRIDKIYNERCDRGLDPMKFSTRLIDIDKEEPINSLVKEYIEDRVKAKLYLCWSQLQMWPLGSLSVRHIHDDVRAGQATHNSLLYLNDDFVGGEFFTDDMIIKPVPGRLTFFDGSKIYHGVNPIHIKHRYSIIFWWSVY